MNKQQQQPLQGSTKQSQNKIQNFIQKNGMFGSIRFQTIKSIRLTLAIITIELKKTSSF